MRINVAYHFDTLCKDFIKPDNDRTLERVEVDALLALHAIADTMTEPAGSEALFDRATAQRKSLVLIGGDGKPGRFRSCAEDGRVTEGLLGAGKYKGGGKGASQSIEALRDLGALDMWHSITTEPGCEKVNVAVAAWMVEEATRASKASAASASPKKRASKSPARSPRR